LCETENFQPKIAETCFKFYCYVILQSIGSDLCCRIL